MESRAHGVWASADGGPRSSIHLHVLFLWAMTHSASPDWFLFSLRISSPPDSNKSKELKFGTCCVLILAKCVWKLFPVWLPFNRYVSMTPDYTEDRKTIWGRVLSKTTLKEGRKEEERKGKHDAKGRIFFFGEEIPPDCILFFLKGSVGGYPKRSLIWNVSLPEFQKSGSGYSMNTAGQKQALDKSSAHWNWFPGSWLTLDELQTCFGSHPERPKWTEPFGWRK